MKGSQITFYTLPDPVQAVNGINTPSLIGQALIPVDLSKDFKTYTQMNKDIIEEIKREKRKNNQINLNNRILTQNEINQIYKKYKEKCDLHFEKLSEKCRKCKIIIEKIKNEENKKNQYFKNQNKKEINQNQKISNYQNKKKNNKEYIIQNSSDGKLNNLLLNNILSCQYFKEVVLYKDFNSLEKEIINNVTNIEAWAVGISGVPSTFFCCLYKLFTLSPSNEQIIHLLKSEFIYVKLIGILYLRFLGEPNYLWEYLSPFLNDKNLFFPKVDKKNKISVSEYVQQLFTDEKHYGTRLPRIPVKIERDIKIKLICYKEMEEREKENMKIIDKFNLGDYVKIYSENNEIEEGIIKSIKQDGMKYSYEIDVNGKNKFVSLGSIEYIDKKNNKKEEFEEGEIIEEKNERSSSKDSNSYYHYHKYKYNYNNHSRSRSREKNNKRINNNNNNYNNKNDEFSLMKQVLESERNTVLAHGKDYAIKPTSFKKSISVKVPGVIKKKFFDNTKNKEIKVEFKNSKEERNDYKKYSEQFLSNQLKIKYMSNNKFNGSLKNNHNDSLGPDIMKLE